MRIAASFCLSLIGTLLLAGCVGERRARLVADKANDEFKVAETYVEARWCVDRTMPIIQPDRDEFWINSNTVVLNSFPHPTSCEPQHLFSSGDEFAISKDAGELFLSVYSRDSAGNRKYTIQHLKLIADSPGPPRYWVGKRGDYDFFVMLSEQRNSRNERVKYYLIEAFAASVSKECASERPDHEGALRKIAVSHPDCPDDTVDRKFFQTDVGGGGEHK